MVARVTKLRSVATQLSAAPWRCRFDRDERKVRARNRCTTDRIFGATTETTDVGESLTIILDIGESVTIGFKLFEKLLC